jgi:hypothetical protein
VIDQRERHPGQTRSAAGERAGRLEPAGSGPLRAVLAHAWLAGILGFAILALLCLDDDLKVHHDAGVYISLATGLATGQGYRDIYFVDRLPHTKYPPLFAVLLAPIVAVFGQHVVAMKLAVFVMACLALVALHRFVGRQEGAVVASLVVTLTATSHGFVFYTDSVMSEIPYVLFSLLALLGLQRLARAMAWTPGMVALVIGCLIATYLTRLLGLSLLIAAVAWTLLEARAPLRDRLRRAALLGGIATVPVVLWFLGNRHLGEATGTGYNWGVSAIAAGQSIGAVVVALVERVAINVVKYVRHAAQIVLAEGPVLSDVVLSGIVAVLIGAGFIGCLVYRRTVLEYYVLVYGTAVIFFPGSRPQRYLVPMIPFVWYYGLLALRHVYRGLRGRLPAPLLASATMAGLVLVLGWNVVAVARANWIHGGRDGYYHVEGEDGYQAAARWARAHAPPGSVFLWAKPALRFVLSGRQGVRPSSLERAATGPGTAPPMDYVVVDRFAERQERYLTDASRHGGIVCALHRDAVSEVYGVGRRCPA